jgi:hypothetical protein
MTWTGVRRHFAPACPVAPAAGSCRRPTVRRHAGAGETVRGRPWVASGAGQHLYWRLSDELPPAEVEELNRRLCHRLGGDPACCEYGRITRLPGTFNQRRGRWCRIVRADRARALVEPEAIRAALPDPEPPTPVSRNGRPGHGSPMADDEHQLVAPPAYFLALCGLRVPEGGGMVRCPLAEHDDAYASCQVYGEAEQGWWCFGCSRGGRIYDLASLMSGGAWGARAARRGVSIGQGEGGGGGPLTQPPCGHDLGIGQVRPRALQGKLRSQGNAKPSWPR